MEVVFFFRKRIENYNSIEELFNTIQQYLEIKKYNIEVPFKSNSILNIYRNAIFSKNRQREINHITGDIHYVALMLNRKKTILTIHDLILLEHSNLFKRMIFKLFWYSLPINRVKFVTVISEYTKAKLIGKVKLNSNKIRVIPNCISDIFEFSQYNFNTKKPTILQIGTKKNKNLERVIEAITEIKCKLIIIGKLSKSQTNKLFKNNIEYENYYNLTHNEVKNLYIKSDLLTFVSLYEGFGMPIIEANATGRPVITSNICSMPEVAGDSAILVNPYKVYEIQSAIINIIENENLRNRLINNGIRNTERFKPEKIAMMYQDLYKQIK